MKRYVKVILSLFVVAVLSLATVYALNTENKNTREYPCYTCNQSGICIGCKGRGTIKAYTIDGTKIITCPNCNGTGKCRYCGGDGIKGN